MEVNNVNWKRINITVGNDKIIIPINRDKVLPAYLHYMLEYKGVDYTGKTLVFNDCKCKLIREGTDSRWEE